MASPKSDIIESPFNIDRSFSFRERSPTYPWVFHRRSRRVVWECFIKWGQTRIIVPTSYISPSVLTIRNEKVKQNQGLMTPHQAGVGIDDLPMLWKRKYRDGITKNIILLTKEMHSLTLLIPCSLILPMVGNGVCLSDSCEPRKHQNSHFEGIATDIVDIALKQKEKFRRNCAISTDFWSEWQDLNLRPLPPQLIDISFFSRFCFF